MGSLGQATNKLGQLFVDIGLGGVGQALKGLNSISASFLLTKNAAMQAMKPFVDFGKEASNNAVQIGKMSAMFGFTMTEYQKLQRYIKDHNLSEGLINDLTKFSDIFMKFRLEGQAIPEWMMIGAQQLGINNLTEYTGSMEDMLNLIERVQKGVAGMDTATARTRLNEMGLSPEWLYAFERADFSLRDALTIPDSDVENLINVSEEWNKTVNDLKTVGQTFVAEIAPLLIDFLKQATPLAKKLLESTEGIVKYSGDATHRKNVNDKINKTARAKAFEEIIIKHTPLGLPLMGAMSVYGSFKKATGLIDLPDNGSEYKLPTLPKTSASNVSVTINNDNRISSDKPFEVVEELNKNNGNSIIRQINTYQPSALPGR